MNEHSVDPEAVQILADLGFTGMEARIYVFLLGESPATGYRIARAIGKPVSNIYKALETLEQKGAVLVDEGPKRLCRAVPYGELLTRLERAFTERRKRAETLLATYPSSPEDHRVYQIRSRDQVFERCRAMLERAQQAVIVDAFPLPLNELRSDIEGCAARGVDTIVKAYEPTEIAGAELLVDHMRETILERWPGQWLNLAVDASEHLLAFLTADGSQVHQAVWSRSPYLSLTYHNGIHAETTLDGIGAVLQRDGSLDEVRAAFARFRRPEMMVTPGYRALTRGFDGAEPPPSTSVGR